MRKSLFIYESHYGTAKKTAEIFALIAANAKVCNVENVDVDFSMYDNIVFSVGFHGLDTAKNTKKIILENKSVLNNKKVGFIGIGLSRYGSDNYLKSVEDILGKKFDYNAFVHGEVRVNKLTAEDKKTLKIFLENQNMKLIDMGKYKIREASNNAVHFRELMLGSKKIIPDEELKKEIDNYVNSKNTCTLCTGDNDFVRGTPIEYIYIHDNFYFITEGGLKFKGILENSKVSLTIFDEYSGFNNLKGLQCQGKAEIIKIGSKEYKEIMSVKGIKEEFLKNAPINMNMIKVQVSKYEFLNSEFKKKGFDAKQSLKIKSLY